MARDNQLDQVFLYDPSIKCFLLFEYGCKYIKDGRNFHILNIEQVGRRLSLAEVERAQLVSGDVGDDGGDDGDGDDDGDDTDVDVPDCNLIFSPGNFSTLFFLQTTEYFIENQEI